MGDGATPNGPATAPILDSTQKDSTEKIGLFCRVSPVHIDSMKYGYARVSTNSQSVDVQMRQLTKAGCKKVFREVASGAKTDRAQLRKAIAMLESGDVLTASSRSAALMSVFKAEPDRVPLLH
jgi:Resolvase, N terminal domain